jgi:hypothetical protein
VKPNTSWKVAEHGPLEQLGKNLWSVAAKLKMPLGETTRHMTVATLEKGGLVIYSAIALAETEMAKLEALGRPRYLVVPSAIHRIDARPWKERYPDLVVVAPAAARDKVGEVVGVDCTLVNLGDPAVRIFTVPGTANRELAMVVGKTLVVNDLIFNLPRLRGIPRLLYRMFGFGPGKPTIPKLVAKKLVDDKAAVKAELRRWANNGFERLLVAHGAPIENPREVLLALAV